MNRKTEIAFKILDLFIQGGRKKGISYREAFSIAKARQIVDLVEKELNLPNKKKDCSHGQTNFPISSQEHS